MTGNAFRRGENNTQSRHYVIMKNKSDKALYVLKSFSFFFNTFTMGVVHKISFFFHSCMILIFSREMLLTLKQYVA